MLNNFFTFFFHKLIVVFLLVTLNKNIEKSFFPSLAKGMLTGSIGGKLFDLSGPSLNGRS